MAKKYQTTGRMDAGDVNSTMFQLNELIRGYGLAHHTGSIEKPYGKHLSGERLFRVEYNSGNVKILQEGVVKEGGLRGKIKITIESGNEGLLLMMSRKLEGLNPPPNLRFTEPVQIEY